MSHILGVNNLITRFHTVDGVIHAVNNVSFNLDEGKTLGIVGESGCGKSVTMQSLLRLIPEPPGKIESGQAIFKINGQGIDLLQLPEREIRKIRGAQFGFVFQDPMTSLHPVLPVGLQISESMIEHLDISRKEARERTIELLKLVGLPNPKQGYKNIAGQFSGGMRQRVMIAMAISCGPKILIADEPTTALDVTIQAQIITLIKRIRDELNMSVIWITHDLGIIAGIADRVLVMYGGQIVEHAIVRDLFKRPLHPYTNGLLGAVPRLDDMGDKRLVSIEGSPPELYSAPTNCQFAPRCKFAFDLCWDELPKSISVTDDHSVACFYDMERGTPRE